MERWLVKGIVVIFLSPFILIDQLVYAADESAPVDEAIDIGAVEVPSEPEEYDALFGSWGGLKDDLAEHGIGIEAVVTGNVMGLTSGGLDRGLYQTFAYQVTTTIDTEKAGLWSNGTFNFSGVALTGPPMHNFVGDYQWANSIDSYGPDTLQLYEAWYEHTFMDGALSVLAGMYEYNSDFYSLDYGTALVNSSFFFGAELSQIGNSTYPVTSLAARVKYQPTENTYVAAAAFDGVPGSPSNYDGTVIKLKKSDGVFYAGEFGVTSSEDDAETGYYKFAIGGWYSTTDFVDYFDRERDDNGGGYIIGEAKIFSECDSPSQGLGIFGQYGMNPGSRNIVSKYIGGGLHYTGLIPGRDEDITAFGVASAITGTQYTDDIEGATRAETAIELTHRIPLMPGVALQPDLQYIVRPGFNSDVSHAMIVGARIDVVF